MTEIDLIYAEDLSCQISHIKALLAPSKWSCTESNMRLSIIEAIKVYPVGRHEVCFILPETIEKISKMIWQELMDRQSDMERDFAKL